jgi:Xaa-Pro aminopeptidase
MRNLLRRAPVAAFLHAALLFGQSSPWYQTDFPPEEFQGRWQKIYEKIGNNAVALLQGMPQVNGYIFPRQTNEFYYLCGIETPGSYLMLDGRSRKATLFMPPRNRALESAEGRILSADDADLVKKLVGVDDVQSTEAMRGNFLMPPGGAGGGPRPPRPPQTIYALFTPAEGNAQVRGDLQSANRAIANDYWDGRLPREMQFISLLRARFPQSNVSDLTPILDEMRAIKSPREIALIRRASELAGLAVMEAMRSARPGLFEYHLDAAARYVFLVNGARLEGYRSIIGAGTANIWNMHYYRNTSELKDGDLVLMDYAPEYHYYTSDVGRMFPVNGKYAPWQRELLQFVREYRNACMSRIRPGVTVQQIMQEAKAAMQPVFARTKFSKPVYEQAARRLVETGGGVFSHAVGLAVHDDGAYARGPLQPGQVFAVDPQLRVPEENLYIRYEDTVVVTEKGYENFMSFLPAELDDIEKLMQETGIVDLKPPTPPEAIRR